jgi:ribosomal-protein-alanine N-acetyltransferase
MRIGKPLLSIERSYPIMEGSVQIGRVEPGDLESIRKLANSRLKEEYTIELIQHFFETQSGCFLTAKDDKNIVGFILGIPMDESSLRILMLVVERPKERSGIGTKLMSYAEAYASSRKMMSLVLEVGTENKAAIEFYNNLGFKITKMISEYYNDKSDAFVMRKFLTM